MRALGLGSANFENHIHWGYALRVSTLAAGL